MMMIAIHQSLLEIISRSGKILESNSLVFQDLSLNLLKLSCKNCFMSCWAGWGGGGSPVVGVGGGGGIIGHPCVGVLG